MILKKDFMDSGSLFHSAPVGRNNRRISENDSLYSFPRHFYYVDLIEKGLLHREKMIENNSACQGVYGRINEKQ